MLATAEPTTALGGTITASAVAVFLINLLKNAKWFPWLDKESKVVARIFALLLSAAGAVGIHATYTGHTLSISGLTLTGILAGGFLWLKSFAFQEWIYQSSKVKTPDTPQPVVVVPVAPPAKP